MDLGLMREKLAGGEYASADAFRADFELMHENCRLFNEGSEDWVVFRDCLAVLRRVLEAVCRGACLMPNECEGSGQRKRGAHTGGLGRSKRHRYGRGA